MTTELNDFYFKVFNQLYSQSDDKMDSSSSNLNHDKINISHTSLSVVLVIEDEVQLPDDLYSYLKEG